MDAEFINAYIAKQKALIDDFQTRLLLTEVKCSLIEQKNSELAAELEKVKAEKPSKGKNE